MDHFKLKRIHLVVICLVALAAGIAGALWIRSIVTFDIAGVMSNFGLGSPIRGYDVNGKLIYVGVLRTDDCVASVNACREAVEKRGGGLCKVERNSLRLRYAPLTRASYERTKIAVE